MRSVAFTKQLMLVSARTFTRKYGFNAAIKVCLFLSFTRNSAWMYKNEFNGIMNLRTLINLNMHSSFVVLCVLTYVFYDIIKNLTLTNNFIFRV